MKSESCITCDKLGVSCAGPNFLLMTSQEVIEWCKARKKHLRIPREKLAETSGIPLGTLNRFFTGQNSYFYFETARHIIRVLVGGEWALDSCKNSDTQDSPDMSLLSQTESLERENDHLRRENEDLKEIITTALSSKF